MATAVCLKNKLKHDQLHFTTTTNMKCSKFESALANPGFEQQTKILRDENHVKMENFQQRKDAVKGIIDKLTEVEQHCGELMDGDEAVEAER